MPETVTPAAADILAAVQRLSDVPARRWWPWPGKRWCGIAARDQWPGRPSVEVKFVAFRVFHRDCVVLQALGAQDTGELGTETGQRAASGSQHAWSL